MMKKVIASALAFTMFFACCAPAAAAENPAAGGPLEGYPGIEALPQIDTLPDPFEFFDTKNDPNGDGYVSNVEEWGARREEIKDLVQHYWLGYKWPTRPQDVQGTVKSVKNNVVTVTITITNPDRIVDGKAVTASFDATVTLPTDEQLIAAWGSADVQVPFVINMGAGALSAANLNPQGYANVTFSTGAIYPDSTTQPIPRNGVYTDLYPYDKDQYEYASGCLMAQAWACSQIISSMEQPSAEESGKTLGQLVGLDPSRTVVTGHSRWGKAAMFAAAFDERISICIPSEPGGSGIQSHRYKVEGKIFNFNVYPKADRVYGKTEVHTVSYGQGNSWFPETAAMFVAHDNQLPFDQHEIIALVAPRPFFVVSGIDSHWLGNEGGVASVQAASEVYEYIGQNDIEKNNIAVRVRESNHQFYNRDFVYALAIMDREFKQDSNDRTLHVQDLFPKGTGLSGMSYPAADYNLVSEFNSYPFDINSSYLPWSSANKYVLWTAQENFLTNHDVTITAHSNAPDVDLYLPDGTTKIDAASHEGEVFTFNVPAAQSIYGRYELRTVGSDKQNRSVFFAAVSLADSLRHGTTKGDEGEENRVLGFSSRLANTKQDPPMVYIGGSATPEPMSFTAERTDTVETTALLEYGVLFHDNLFVKYGNDDENPNKWTPDMTFNVKNLKFVTIPDYVFEFSMNNIYASAKAGASFWGPGRPGTDGAAKFTTPISWPVEKYNNGPAPIWPPIPDTLAERAILEAGGTVERPEAPAPKETNFKAAVLETVAEQNGDNTEIKIIFSEPLNKGQYGVGINVASKFTTSWNEDGTMMILTIANSDLTSDANTADILIFRLFDKEGNQLGGPIEASVNLSTEAPDYNVNVFTTTAQPEVGETSYVWLNADKNFAASEFAVTYDPALLTFDAKASTLNGAAYAETEAGFLKFTDYGDERQSSYGLAFKAIKEGQTVVTVTAAAFGTQKEAETMDLTPAVFNPASAAITIREGKFEVALDEIYTGSTSVAEGEDYTFAPADNANYNYSDPVVTVNGQPAEAVQNENGSWTVANITGDVVITGTRTAKTYRIDFTYDGDLDLALPEDGAVTYGEDFSFELPVSDTHGISAEVEVNGNPYTPTVVNGVVTIKGTDISGNIAVSFIATRTTASVEIDGSAASDAANFKGYAKPGEDYVLTLNKDSVYDYVVTAAINGVTYELTVDGDAYIIKGDAFKADDVIAFNVVKTLILGDVEKIDYLTLDGSVMKLVVLRNELAEGRVYTYNTREMFWSDKYNAYVLLEINPNEVEDVFDIADRETKTVDYGGDVNMTGSVDMNDAQLIYNMYNVHYNNFTYHVTMEKFLRADVNGDMKLDVLDAAMIVSAAMN